MIISQEARVREIITGDRIREIIATIRNREIN